MKVMLSGVIVVVLLLAGVGSANACSCIRTTDAGFIHAATERLPANAKGALFRPPIAYEQQYSEDGRPSSIPADAFVITSTETRGNIPAVVTWLPEYKLARIGPARGFRPGVRYTITFTGKWEGLPMFFPKAASFTIDEAALPEASRGYGAVLDGRPVRTLIPLSSIYVCSEPATAVVQAFHHTIPASDAPYRAAIYYNSLVKHEGEAAYVPIDYKVSYCSIPAAHGRTALDGGKDLVHARCAPRSGTAKLRAAAGILEVDDKLHTTELEVDFDSAPGTCSTSSILKLAMEQGDPDRIKAAMCSIDKGSASSRFHFSAQTTPQLNTAATTLGDDEIPPLGPILASAAGDVAWVRSCATRVLSVLVTQAKSFADSDLILVAELLRANAGSGDTARLYDSANLLSDSQYGNYGTPPKPAVAPGQRRQRLVDLLGPALVEKITKPAGTSARQAPRQ